METANAIQQILSGDCAIMQDFDGGFYLLTNHLPSVGGASDTERLATLFSEVLEAGNEPVYPETKQFELHNPLFFEQFPGGSPDTSLSPPSPAKIFRHCIKIQRGQLLSAIDKLEFSAPAFSAFHWEPASATDFSDDFQTIQEAIAQGTIEKAVIMTQECSSWVPGHQEKVFLLGELLRKAPSHLFIYAHWNGEGGVMGATPEWLFYRNGLDMESMALAGTLPKDGDSMLDAPNGESLLKDPKERFEHQLVVDDLSEKWELFCKSLWAEQDGGSHPPFSALTIEGPEILELPHLFHIQSKLKMKLPEAPEFSMKSSHIDLDLRLIGAFHPSSALGLRSQKAETPWTWLRSLKGHRQLGHFGAPLGLNLPGDRYLCLVGIRNIEWDQKNTFLRSGSGIVHQSQEAKEWKELEAKRNSIKSLLGMKTQAALQAAPQEWGRPQLSPEDHRDDLRGAL